MCLYTNDFVSLKKRTEDCIKFSFALHLKKYCTFKMYFFLSKETTTYTRNFQTVFIFSLKICIICSLKVPCV